MKFIKQKKETKRKISFLLALAMIVSLLPVLPVVKATTTETATVAATAGSEVKVSYPYEQTNEKFTLETKSVKLTPIPDTASGSATIVIALNDGYEFHSYGPGPQDCHYDYTWDDPEYVDIIAKMSNPSGSAISECEYQWSYNNGSTSKNVKGWFSKDNKIHISLETSIYTTELIVSSICMKTRKIPEVPKIPLGGYISKEAKEQISNVYATINDGDDDVRKQFHDAIKNIKTDWGEYENSFDDEEDPSDIIRMNGCTLTPQEMKDLITDQKNIVPVPCLETRDEFGIIIDDVEDDKPIRRFDEFKDNTHTWTLAALADLEQKGKEVYPFSIGLCSGVASGGVVQARMRHDSIVEIVNGKKVTINMTEPKKFTEDEKVGYHKKYYVLQKYNRYTMYWNIDEDGERELRIKSDVYGLEISECNYQNGNISFNCGGFPYYEDWYFNTDTDKDSPGTYTEYGWSMLFYKWVKDGSDTTSTPNNGGGISLSGGGSATDYTSTASSSTPNSSTVPTSTDAPSTSQAPTVSTTPTNTASASSAPSASIVPPSTSSAPSDADMSGTSPAPSAPANVNVGKKTTVKNAIYKVTSIYGTKTVQFTGNKKNTKNVIIPATIKIDGKTYKVTTIAKNALKGNKKLTKVTIGKNINKIGKNAFKGCKNLKNIVIKTTKLKAKNVGANAFKNINKTAKFKVPNRKVKSYKKMIQAKGASKKIKVKK